MTDLDLYFQGRDTVVPYVAQPEPKSEVEPYTTPGEAITDLATSLAAVAVKLAPPVGTLVTIVGAGYFVLSAIGGACAAAMAWGAANASMIGAGLVGVVAVWVAKSGIQEKRASISSSGSDGRNGSAQSVNITINVAGNAVTTNTNKQ